MVRRRRLEEGPAVARLGQQRLLDFGGDADVLFELRLLERRSIEARVLDRQRGLGGERLEGAAGRRGQQRPALARVEIEHADAARGNRPDRGGVLDVAHHVQRHAQDVADAERHRAHVDVGQLAVEEVGDQPRVARLEDLFRNLAAGLEGAALQLLLAAAAAHLELEGAVVAGEHDEAALGAADVDGRVEHQRQHVVEHAAGAERPQPLEQARRRGADRRSRRRPVPRPSRG